MDNQKEAQAQNIATPRGLMDMSSRLTGTGALAEAIARLRRKADQLEALHNSLPRQLSPDADNALWEMAMSVGR